MNEVILTHLARTQAILEVLIKTYSNILAINQNTDAKPIIDRMHTEINIEADIILKRLKAELHD